MEKAKLSVRTNKKSSIHVEITFGSGKKINLPDTRELDKQQWLKYDGLEVEVERIEGQITKIMLEEDPIYSKQIDTTPKKLHNSQSYNQQSHHKGNRTGKATAPYNFIPLNDTVVPCEKKPMFNGYEPERKTGYIEVTVETKTPMYIRNVKSSDDLIKGEGFIVSNFFSPAQKHRIPGSSFRGLIRTMVEILSFSRVKFIDHKKSYFYRSFADKSLDLRDYFVDKMIDVKYKDKTTSELYSKSNIENNSNKYIRVYSQKVEAGFLYKEGRDNFSIIPAASLTNDIDLNYFRVEQKLVIDNKVLKELMAVYNNDNPRYKFGFKKVYFKYDQPTVHPYTVSMYFSKVTDISLELKAGLIPGYLIHSGWMRNKRQGKHLHWVISEDQNQERLTVPQKVVTDYIDDKYRFEQADLLKYFKDSNCKKVPCFFIRDNNGGVHSFGHTGLFRLAYDQSIGELIPQIHQSSDKMTDIAESIFGNETSFCGRVFFEDCYLTKDSIDKTSDAEEIPKILSEPRPSLFNHYLKQNPNNIQPEDNKYNELSGYRNIMDYNSEGAEIGGNKLYWHRDTEFKEDTISFNTGDYNCFCSVHDKENLLEGVGTEKRGKIHVRVNSLTPEQKLLILESLNFYMVKGDKKEKIEKQHTKIKPVDKGACFKGKIRFENLSSVELGALLSALKLKDNLCHKIGMGKPLGMGSIKVTPQLFISNREQRYKDILAEFESIPEQSAQIDKCIAEFEKYVLENIGEKSKTTIWDTDRIKQLECMLNWDKKPDHNDTEYMTLKSKRFSHREILHKPEEYIKKP